MEFAQSERTDMFLKENFDVDGFVESCKPRGLNPQFNWALDNFGGRNVKKDFYHASNIIFSNGAIDPWISGGVTTKINDNIVVKVLQGGAHHLDLRLPNDADPQDVKDGRDQFKTQILTWINEWRQLKQNQEKMEFI